MNNSTRKNVFHTYTSIFFVSCLFFISPLYFELEAVKKKNHPEKKSVKKVQAKASKTSGKTKTKTVSKKAPEKKPSHTSDKIHEEKKKKQEDLKAQREKERKQREKEKKIKLVQKKRAEQEKLAEEKPPTYDEILYRDDDHILQIRARAFKQGNLAFLKIYSNVPNCTLDLENYKVYWREKQIPLIPYKNYHIAILPIHPDEKVGIHYLDVEKIGETKIIRKKFPIEIDRTFFPERKMYSILRIPKRFKRLPQETVDFIQQCDKKKKEVFGLESENKVEGDFEKPLDKIYITSPFYVKRYYSPTKVKPHGGIDLRGKVGEPIYAIQSGKVVIAERMYFEGIFTVIDHGNKMFSLYMHQSKLYVKEGDIVKKGTLIGEVGSTGMSTGPHLHLGLKVSDIVLNPLSVVGLNLF